MGAWRIGLVTAVALVAGCDEGEPCGVMPGQTAADCVPPEPTRFTITFEGSGQGWVQVMEGGSSLSPARGTGLLCTESCTLEVPPTPSGLVVLRAGTTQKITAFCGVAGPYATECQLPWEDQEVSVTFDKDADEVSTLFLEDAVRSLAFVSDGDLVMATHTSLRRVGTDGTQRWSVPRSATRLVATNATDLIVVGPDVAAYRGDGSPAWSAPYEATAVATLPDGDPIIVTSGGNVVVLSAANGSVRWQSGAVGATKLAVDAAGIVAVSAGETILRFDANGAVLPSWLAPASIEHLFVDTTGQLVVTHLEPGSLAGSPESSLDYFRFDPTGAATKLFTRLSLPPHGFATAGDRLLHWSKRTFALGSFPVLPAILSLSALDEAGTQTWSLTKGYGYSYKGTHGADIITPTAATCDAARRCAVAGIFDSPPGAGMMNWVGVYTIR